MGFQRQVTGLASGVTPAGHVYRTFRYRYSGGMSRFDASMLAVELPFSLPDVFWSTSKRPRAGVDLSRLAMVQDTHVRLWADDAELAQCVFAAVADPTDDLAMLSFGAVDLGVDRNQLVAVEPPEAESLPPFLAVIDELVDALAAVPANGELPPAPSGFGFYGHPNWRYAPDGDKGLLREYGLRSRHLSRVEDVITSRADGIRLTAFRHTWVSEALNGILIPRTVQVEDDREQEAFCAFDLGSRIPDLSLNGDPLGGQVTLGNQRFIETFSLRSADPQQAYPLFNDRVRDWLMATRPYGWTVRGGRVRFHVPSHDPVVVGECERTLYGWLGRVQPKLLEVMGLPAIPDPEQ